MGSQQTGESKLGLENKGHQMLMKMGKKKDIEKSTVVSSIFLRINFW